MAFALNCMAQICPGLKNPTSFDDGSDSCKWYARTGTYVYFMTGQSLDYGLLSDGYRINNTCPKSPNIFGHTNITSTTLNPNQTPDECMSSPTTNDKGLQRFRIVTQDDENDIFDAYTLSADGSGLRRVPNGYTSVVRLGNMSAATTDALRFQGYADTNRATYTWRLRRSSEALFYQMHVRPENAVISLNYALVTRLLPPGSTGAYCAGECIMRIVEQNDDGSWPTDGPIGSNAADWNTGEPIDSSKCVRIVAYNDDNNNNPDNALWQMGLVNSDDCKFMYTPWRTVSADLTKSMDKTVRIEIYTSDGNNKTPLYGYFAGDFAPCAILAFGCTPDSSDALDTLFAPAGMQGYKWYASDNGQLDLTDATTLESSPFRELTPANYDGTTGNPSFSYKFATHYDDYLHADGSVGDTQTFCCVIYHGFNTEHKDSTRIYINIPTNVKPAAMDSIVSPCGGPIELYNTTPNRPGLDTAASATTWYIYSIDTISNTETPVDTLVAKDTTYNFDVEGYYKVKLKVVSDNGACVGTDTVRAFYGATSAITTLSNTVCDGEKAHLYGPDDTMIVSRKWTIGDHVFETNIANAYDSLITDELALGPNTVQLVVFAANGCSDTAETIVNVYGTPILSFIDNSENAICPGDSAMLKSVGTYGPDNIWTSVPLDPLLADQQGRDVVMVKPDTTTVYTLVAPENSSCGQQDKSITLEVIPAPTPKIKLSNTFVNTDHPVILAEDISPYGARTHWELSDGTTGDDRFIRHTFTDLSVDKVTIKMTSCNRLDCPDNCNDTVIYLPIETAIHWIPNVFTPDRDNNNLFGISFSQDVYEYELYIYNRNGQLVFESTDQEEKWDGTMDGTPCPTGAYAFFLRYRFDYNDTRHITKGIVTLVR